MPSPAGGREILFNGPDLPGGGIAYTVPGGQYFFPEMIKWIVGCDGVGDHFPQVSYIDATSGVIAYFQSMDGFPDAVVGFVTFAVGMTKLAIPTGTNQVSTYPLPPVGLGEGTQIQIQSAAGAGAFWGLDSIEEVRIYGYYTPRDVEDTTKFEVLSPLLAFGAETV